MIRPKTAKPSPSDETDAYELCTLRDGDTCQRCHRDCGPTARDHRQNRMPGNTIVSNLQVLGLACHIWKTEHPKEAIADGWGMPRHTLLAPSEWPARRWIRTKLGTVRLAWVLYDDEGSWAEISDAEAAEIMEGLVA